MKMKMERDISEKMDYVIYLGYYAFRGFDEVDGCYDDGYHRM